MRVRMLKTTNGSEDGINVRELIEGQVYSLAPRLTEILLDGGLAVEDKPEAKPEPKPEAKPTPAKRTTKRAGPKERKR